VCKRRRALAEYVASYAVEVRDTDVCWHKCHKSIVNQRPHVTTNSSWRIVFWKPDRGDKEGRSADIAIYLRPCQQFPASQKQRHDSSYQHSQIIPGLE